MTFSLINSHILFFLSHVQTLYFLSIHFSVQKTSHSKLLHHQHYLAHVYNSAPVFDFCIKRYVMKQVHHFVTTLLLLLLLTFPLLSMLFYHCYYYCRQRFHFSECYFTIVIIVALRGQPLLCRRRFHFSKCYFTIVIIIVAEVSTSLNVILPLLLIILLLMLVSTSLINYHYCCFKRPTLLCR